MATYAAAPLRALQRERQLSGHRPQVGIRSLTAHPGGQREDVGVLQRGDQRLRDGLAAPLGSTGRRCLNRTTQWWEGTIS